MSAGRRSMFALLLGALACAACGGDDTSGGGLAGTYLLDRDALAQDFLEEEMRRMNSAERAALTAGERRDMLAEVRATAAARDVRLDLMQDGSFVVRYRYENEEGRRRGTWQAHGGRIVLVTTHSASGPLARSRELRGVVSQGTLRFESADTLLPHPFTLRRR